jgi:hypothetical protein
MLLQLWVACCNWKFDLNKALSNQEVHLRPENKQVQIFNQQRLKS